MKTDHTLVRLHKILEGDAETVCLAVQGFMGNLTGKDFDCRAERGDRWFDIVAKCTDSQEKIAHAVAWGCFQGMRPFIRCSLFLEE